MSSLIDVPLQLALVLSLAAATGGAEPSGAKATPTLALSGQQASVVAQPVAGPFGFSESLWLRALKECAQTGVSARFSGRIFKTSGGRFYVPAMSERDEILAARWDVAVASRVARAFAELNARRLRPAIGRAPTSGELYLAHLFGPEAAVSVIKLARTKPADLAAEHFQDLLETAPELLFDDGKSVTVAALYDRFMQPLRERKAPSQITQAQETRETAPERLALKPTLVGPDAEARQKARALAFAWRSQVTGVGDRAPLQ